MALSGTLGTPGVICIYICHESAAEPHPSAVRLNKAKAFFRERMLVPAPT